MAIRDTIQIGAAILSKAEIFITNDKQVIQIKQINVNLLDDFLD